jgi:hypothetical protein
LFGQNAMLNGFAALIFEEVLSPVVAGFFRRAQTSEIRRWKIAAWSWIWASIAAFALASWLEHPVGIGLEMGAGIFAIIASLVSGASTSILHQRFTTTVHPQPTGGAKPNH